MASTDGVRRFTTYGKRRTHVAVSHRDWWSTVSATASTSTSRESHGQSQVEEEPENDEASPTYRVLKKADLKDKPLRKTGGTRRVLASSKHVAVSKTTTRRAYVAKDSDNETEASSGNSSDSYIDKPASARADSGAVKTPANAPRMRRKPTENTSAHQTHQVIDIDTSTSEEENEIQIKAVGSSAAKAARAGAAARPRRRIIIEDSPPASPNPNTEDAPTYSQSTINTKQVTLKAPVVSSGPLPSPVKPTILGRKDSNHVRTAYTEKVQQSKPSLPVTETRMPNRLTTSTKDQIAQDSYRSKENQRPATHHVPSLPTSVLAKVSTLAGKTPAARPSMNARSSKHTTSTKSSSAKSSASAQLHLPPPRGHHAGSSVAWRRPLTPIVHANRSIKSSGHTNIQQIARPNLSQLQKLHDTASPTRKARSKPARVVVEIPLGLPRSRSPAPVKAYSSVSKSDEPSEASPSGHLVQRVSTAGPLKVSSQDKPLQDVKAVTASPETNTLGEIGLPIHTASSLKTSSSDEHSSAAEPDPLGFTTQLQSLLALCSTPGSQTVTDIPSFENFVTGNCPFLGNGEQNSPATWRKLGEATYSEVFEVTVDNAMSATSGPIVVKAIPLHMPLEAVLQEEKVEDAFEPAGQNTLEPFTTDITDVYREISILGELSAQSGTSERRASGWSVFRGAYVVKGKYPQALLETWDAYKLAHPQKSENPRPDALPSHQIYALICMEHAGEDLESVKLRSWTEAVSILWQVASALARAEASMQFEHRDLHWGNVLIRPAALEEQLHDLSLNENTGLSQSDTHGPACLQNTRQEVTANIIDFTLSRATIQKEGKAVTLAGGFEDESMFSGEGDYQYECYRIMRKVLQDDWQKFCPLTNVVWLHYLASKLLHNKGLRKPSHRNSGRTASGPILASSPMAKIRTRRLAVISRGKGAKTASAESGQDREAYLTLAMAETYLKQTLTKSLAAIENEMGQPSTGSNPHEVNDSAGSFVSWFQSV